MEGNIQLLTASSQFTISEGSAAATTTYRDQETPFPDSNYVALVISCWRRLRNDAVEGVFMFSGPNQTYVR